jgi:hypothetical protein
MPPKRGRGSCSNSGGSNTRKPTGSGSAQGQGQGYDSKLALDVRESNQVELANFAETQPHLKHVYDSIPIFKELVPVKLRGKVVTLDAGCTLVDWKPDQPFSNEGLLTVQKVSQEGRQQSQHQAYQKTIPLINPYHWMRHGERPAQPFTWAIQTQTQTKTQNQSKTISAPENQAYVDTIASALASKLRTHISSPHFCTFYGAYRAVTDSYKYNLEEDLEEFRFTKWFWQVLDSGGFTLSVTEKSTGRRLSVDELKSLLKPDDEFLDDSSESGSEEDTDLEEDTCSELSAESLEELESGPGIDVPSLEEVTTLGNEGNELDGPVLHIQRRQGSSARSVTSLSTASDDSSTSFTDEYDVFAEFKGMPVVQVFLEKLTGTMDSLLETSDLAPANTVQKETIWAAWLFQICAALSQLQTVLHLTHNDLHTNNVLWKHTDQEFLWYKDTKGQVWKVPTYGRIFSIIDYGRAIFILNGHTCISSDYDDNHDAAGMYNFGPIEDRDEPRVPPNKSFDLCRLTCSLLRALYPRNPVGNPKGAILTKENAWEVRETDHALFNVLWLWLKSRSGGNVLETESGKEKYPGFQLYSEIAAEVRSAIPNDQFGKPVFQQFRLVTGQEIPSTTVQCISLLL